MDTLTIKQPDDWHLHLRDGDVLNRTVADTARVFHRAIIMPNLNPPVRTVADAESYRERILAASPSAGFTPLMTLYLTDRTDEETIIAAAKHPHIYACKLYPAGATTNSEFGVSKVSEKMPVFEAMAEHGLPLLIHGEVTESHVDIFEREAAFIEHVLRPLSLSLPTLKIVLEHITTKDAVDFVLKADENVGATITAHHLMLNRNDMLAGGIRPHYYCLPILKRREHQEALRAAATSGHHKFFLGTDSAPHARDKKESPCGCAGIYSAHCALELYASVFEEMGALDKLEAFASLNGPAFYGLAANDKTVTLTRTPQTLPDTLSFGASELIPLAAGQTLAWQVKT